MNSKQFINQEVSVNSFNFQGKSQLRTIPKQITYNNKQVTFIDSGMRYILKKGQEITQLFDMSDGQNNYRLQVDETNLRTTLLRISPLAN